MGKCKYCQKDAGFLSSTHKECERFAKETMDYFAQLASHAILHGGDADELKKLLSAAAQQAALTTEQRVSAVLQAITTGIESAMEDGIVSSEEEKNLVMLTQAMSVPRDTLHALPEWAQVVKSRVLADIFEGKVPDRFTGQGVNVVLQKGEKIIWGFGGVQSYEMRTRRHYVGSSVGVSVRIAKGVCLRSSAFRGHPVETTESIHADTGELILTNKNVFFQGSRGAVKMPVRKLVFVDPYSDGIGLQLDGVNAKPRTFQGVDGWFAYNVITNLHLLE